MTTELEGEGMLIPTYKLLSGYKEKYPDYDFRFACGSDLFHFMGRWLYGKELLNEVSFIIFKRRGDKDLDSSLLPKTFEFIETHEVSEMSSTIVRNTLKWMNFIDSFAVCN